MPVFEFQCQRCGRRFEKFVFSFRLESVTCPSCGSDSVQKVISPFASGKGSSASSCRPSG
jgi:putative FmdB family regulatory protein